MELEKLPNLLEALLFVSGEALSVTDIMAKLELQESEIEGAINKLKEKYSGSCGIHILRFNDKVQLCTNPQLADDVSLVLNPIKEKNLSRSCLEVMAIIAYKQPVTRLEIEQVRGCNSDYALQTLNKHSLIKVVGRKDVVGKPLLFGTTEEFLKRFDLKDLSDLPDYEKLLERITLIEGPKDESLYNTFEIPEEELPEFLEGESITKIE